MRAPSPLPPFALNALPTPNALAALGTVLCVYRSRRGDGLGGELGGWQQAVRAETWCGIDSDGWQECLQFRDRDGDCCWRLYLLPDSDFLAWERIQQALPRVDAPLGACRDCGPPHDDDGVAGRLWRRLSHRLAGERWQVSALRLHALPVSRATRPACRVALAASLATVSSLGADMLQRIARWEDIDLGGAFDDDAASPWRPLAAH
jgi:hypothetical protein